MATPLTAATPRQILIEAAFQTRDKTHALAQIAEADRGAAALVAADPGNRDAAFVRAMALGYRAKLTRGREDALAARKLFERFVAANPRDPDAATAVGTWHLDSVIDLGGFVAGVAIGAKKATGLAMMDRAVTLGGNRATYPGFAALLRLSIDPADPRARALAEMASAGDVSTPLDRIMQRHASAILISLRAGDRDATQKLARQLLPFGRVKR
ncbi:MAG: hypothetical protein EOP61_18230 [Sphingomonadales bacterium]|nr:MAG: hypothetical protein EOP61_18230 [Sphingomonadales bacterium]